MKTPQPLQLKFGICPFTGKKIAEIKDGEVVRLKGFSKYWLSLSNGSKMEVWIHKDYEPTEKDSEKLLESHKVFWTNDLKLKQQQLENQYKSFNALSLVAQGRQEKDLQE